MMCVQTKEFNTLIFSIEAGLFDAALTLMKQKDGEMTFVNKLDKSGLALIHIACASGAMVTCILFGYL